MELWYRKSLLCWLFAPFALLFGMISGLRRYAFRHGWLKSYRSPLPIIVVGNLSVGGNGKTPLVLWLVEQLRAKGYRPAIISRGYGGKAQSYPLRVTASTTATECGDEPLLLFRRANCPVVVAPKRAQAVQLLEQSGEVDLIIADDGLQHYHLQRDIELIVVDGQRRFGNECLLPMGPLREPLSRLKRVDAVICNGANPQAGEYPMQLIPAEPRRVIDEQTGLNAPNTVDAIAAIGHPPRFFATLENCGFKLNQRVAFSDHHAFSFEELKSFSERPLLMTEKDAVKCRAFAQENWWYLPVSAEIPASLLTTILQKLPPATPSQ